MLLPDLSGIKSPVLALLAMAGLAVSGCGQTKKALDWRSDNSDPLNESPAPETVKTPESKPKKPGAPTNKPEVDDGADAGIALKSINHATGRNFFQGHSDLSDLFADGDQPSTSQLCWPAAMAYQMDFLARKTPALALEDSQETGYEPAAIRRLTDFCGTDMRIGTTMPQGASCIDRWFSEASEAADIDVTGLDGKWKQFGMYPETVEATEAVVKPDTLKDIVTRGSAAILFIGFYKYDREKAEWHRERGHFVSLTGMEWAENGSLEQSATIYIVNPATDYSTRASNKFDRVLIRRMPPQRNGEGLPDISWQLNGPGITFTGYQTVLESVVAFSTTGP